MAYLYYYSHVALFTKFLNMIQLQHDDKLGNMQTPVKPNIYYQYTKRNQTSYPPTGSK